MLRQHVQLVAHRPAAVGDVEQVARVAVLRHEPQGVPLTGAADEDRGVGPCGRRRVADRVLQPVVRAMDGLLVAGPHGQRDAQRLAEPFEPVAGVKY